MESTNRIKKDSRELPAVGSLLEGEFQNSRSNHNRFSSSSQVLSRFERAKFRSQNLAGYFQAIINGEIEYSRDMLCDLVNRRRKLHQCGSLLTIRDYFESGRVEHFASRCRQHMLCQGCAIIRGSRTMSNILRRVQEKHLYNYYPYLLTVTVQNGSSLIETFRNLSGSWSKLVDRRKGRSGFGSNSLNLLSGGVATIEVKRGRSQGWHPHIHALVFSREPLPVVQAGKTWLWPDLSAEWFSITGNSKIVECHPIYDSSGVALTPDRCFMSISGDNSIIHNDFIHAVCEVSKYSLKLSDMSNSDVLEVWQTLHGSRFVRTFGEMYGKVEDDEEPEPEIIERFVETVYQWRKGGYSAIRYKISDGFAY